MLHLLIAPNAFKNTLTATEAAVAMLEGFLASGVPFTHELFPVGDGGDGTGDLLIDRFKGHAVSVNVTDPLGRPIESKYGVIDHGQTAIIEMTYASGIKLLHKDELDPLNASSYGTGQLMKHALDHSIKNFILTLGGSATVDGGTGILRALGFQFLDVSGNELQYIREMNKLHSIETSHIHPMLKEASIIVLCDVKNILCGPEGAAAVYGPQKGADADAVNCLDEALHQLAIRIEQSSGKSVLDLPAGGSAGGTAASLHALLNANLTNGIDYFLDVTGFNNSLSNASIVITGEGRLDEQTMQGKAPFGVASRAKAAGKTTMCIAGIVPPEPNESMNRLFDYILQTIPSSHRPERELAFENLKQTAMQAATKLFLQS